MQARVDWVLIIFGTQVIKKKRPVRPVFPDYLSVSYDYAPINKNYFDVVIFNSKGANASSLTEWYYCNLQSQWIFSPVTLATE